MEDAIKRVLNSYVIESPLKSYRWLDGWGDVVKYKLDNGFPVDDTTGDPLGWTSTVVEVGTGTQVFTASTTAGEIATITTAANEYDGGNYQIKGEGVKFVASKPFYAGAQVKFENGTKSDFLFGLCETDTTLMATSTAHAIAVTGDGAFFATLAGSTDVNVYTYDGGASKNNAAVDTTLDNAYHWYEIVSDGSTIEFYFDGTKVSCFTADLPDGDLTLSLNFRAGDDSVEVCSVKDLRVVQVNS